MFIAVVNLDILIWKSIGIGSLWSFKQTVDAVQFLVIFVLAAFVTAGGCYLGVMTPQSLLALTFVTHFTCPALLAQLFTDAHAWSLVHIHIQDTRLMAVEDWVALCHRHYLKWQLPSVHKHCMMLWGPNLLELLAPYIFLLNLMVSCNLPLHILRRHFFLYLRSYFSICALLYCSWHLPLFSASSAGGNDFSLQDLQTDSNQFYNSLLNICIVWEIPVIEWLPVVRDS